MKKLAIAVMMLCMIVLSVGCKKESKENIKTYKSYTFSVDTGDKVKLDLNTTDGFDISSKLPFEISCNGKVLSQGTFITSEQYEQYVLAVKNDAEAKILDTGSKDDGSYIFWSYNDSEYNYAILISDSQTGMLLGNTVSEETASECFDRLTIELEDK